MADEPEPKPTPIVDKTPVGHTYLNGIVFALGWLTVIGIVKLVSSSYAKSIEGD